VAVEAITGRESSQVSVKITGSDRKLISDVTNKFLTLAVGRNNTI